MQYQQIIICTGWYPLRVDGTTIEIRQFDDSKWPQKWQDGSESFFEELVCLQITYWQKLHDDKKIPQNVVDQICYQVHSDLELLGGSQ